MKIYNFDKNTGEFLGSSNAKLDPLESDKNSAPVYLLPANATTIQPPELGANEAAVYKSGAWVKSPDHRGKTLYNTTNKTTLVVEELGDLPVGYTELEPGVFDSWDGSQWVEDRAARDADSIQSIKAEANRRILEIAPEWKQRNLLARTVELRDIQDGRALTAEEQAEKDASQSVWNVIKSIRTYSDQLEIDVLAGKSIDIESGWPV